MYLRSNNSTFIIVDSGAVTANAWHTVIAWHDSQEDKIKIQVDNGTIYEKTISTGTMDTANPLTIGALPDTCTWRTPAPDAGAGECRCGTYGLNGYLDEVAIYRRVLNDEERAWLYNNGQSRYYSELAITYAYGDSAHAHAVTSLSHGNQIKRMIGADTYDLKYDAENHLVEVPGYIDCYS